MRLRGLAFGFWAFYAPQVRAWGAAGKPSRSCLFFANNICTVGHEIVATIAQIHLHPTTVEKLCSILPKYAECHLAPIATWADKVRVFYKWSSHMHYVGDTDDHPGDHCVFGEGGWEDPAANVLTAIHNTSQWLKDGREGAEEALKFLVHFMGDLHMPLHLTGRDRGGNDMKVKFGGRMTSKCTALRYNTI